MSMALGIVRGEVVRRDAQLRFRGADKRQRRAAASEGKGSMIGRGRKSTGKRRSRGLFPLRDYAWNGSGHRVARAN